MKLLIVAIIILSVHTAEAETVLQLHAVSYHQNRAANYNEENYGIGIRHYVENKQFDYVNAGFYDNSENNTSKYIGIGYEWKVGIFKMGINAGVVDGYSLASTLPYVVPVISYENVSLTFAPYPEMVAHLSYDLAIF